MRRTVSCKIGFMLVLTALVLFMSLQDIYGEENTASLYLDGMDFEQIQEVMDEETDLNFRELVEQMFYGKTEDTGNLFANKITEIFFGSVFANRDALLQVMILSAFGAICTAMANAFSDRKISEMGFYICYLCMIGFLMAAFVQASEIAIKLLELLIQFMQALIPSYYIGMTISGATGSYVTLCGVLLLAISLVERVIRSILIPAIQIYLILMLLNFLQAEETLSKLGELIKTCIEWTAKTVFAAVIGLQLVQNLILPYVNSVKTNLIYRAVTAIPGIGNSIGSVSSVVIGSGMLIRNSIGVAAIVVIVLFCLTPVIQMTAISLMYQAGAAVVQPFADKRMVGCISAVSISVKLLLKLTVIAALMFLLTVALLCGTNMQGGTII